MGDAEPADRLEMAGAGGRAAIYQNIRCVLRPIVVPLIAAGMTVPATSAHADTPASMAAGEVFDLSIEELGELRVTSVSRRSEPWYEAPSAIYVITDEDIRRSGFTRLPEILRLAPGVEVARNGSHSWTISIRGFNSDLSNKLLVLIDGRSVYSPLFAGVFWDAQNVMVEDIERIEVISGPGGTLWGANAVNGVINIITRSAGETQGTLVDVGAGNEQRASIAVRHGWEPADDIATRAYFEYRDHDESLRAPGQDGVDDGRMLQAGFRTDWERSGSGTVTLQGDAYDAKLGAMVRPEFTVGTLPGPDQPGHVDIDGFNVLARWLDELDHAAHLQLQAYLDHTSRHIPGIFGEDRDTFDIAFQHDLAPAGRHHVIWGGGFRLTSDELDNTTFASFIPDERTDRTFNLFVQDEIRLWSEDAILTAGTKIERNDYTGWEFQPNLRLQWAAGDRQFLWGAVSRAVRIPARLNADLVLLAPIPLPDAPVPFYVNVLGSDDFRSEELLATEIGYRWEYGEDLSFDVSLFRHDYDNLQTQETADPSPVLVPEPVPHLRLITTLDNKMQGDTYGGTVVANWQPVDYWRLQFQYAYLGFDLGLEADSNNADALSIAGNSPEHQAAVISWLELPRNFDLFTALHYVDELPSLGVPDRTAVDLSLGWEPREELRLSLTVRDLADDEHLEFGGSNLIERSAWLRVVWTP